MTKNINKLLNKAGLKNYNYTIDNDSYVIELADSDDYGKIYSQLDSKLENTENPNFGIDDKKTTVKITNYFEVEFEGVLYNVFLIADFVNDRYYVRIKER